MKRSCVIVILVPVLAILAACASTQPYQTKKSVTSIAFSPDETLLAIADANEIRVLEVDSKRHVMILRELPQDPEGADPGLFRHGVGDSMVFLDKDRIATSGMGGLVSIWNVHSGRRLNVIDSLPGEEFASTIDYSPATNRMVIGTSTGQILLTTLKNDNAGPLVPMAKLESYIWDLQFSRDGLYIASASLKLTKPQNYESTDEAADSFAQVMSKPLNDEPMNDSADEFAHTMSNEGPGRSNVIIWDVDRLEKVGDLEGATGVLKMALVPEERALITAGEKVQIWEFLTQKQSEEISDPNMVMQGIGLGAIAVVSVASLGAGIITPGSFLGQTFLNSGFPFIPTAAFMQHACARTAAISPDGQTIISTTWGPTHNVMSVISRKENKVIEKWTADSSVCDLQFSTDGKQLVAATSRGLSVYDTTSWKKTKL